MAKSKSLTTTEEQSAEQVVVTPKPTVKNVQMHAGVDMIGAKTHALSRDSDIYEIPQGLLLVSKKTKRKVVVPYANIRAYELL